MKHEETLKKAIQAFRDDDDDVLLRLALLKERADYRKFFTVALRRAVETAYSRIDEENAKGPGHFADEETENTIAVFLGKLRWTSPDFVDNRQVWFDAALSKSW